MSKIRALRARLLTLASRLSGPRKAVPQMIELAGFAAISAGFWQIAEPAGLIVAGTLAAFVAYTLEKP